jgi:hypothetical protein
VLVYAAPAVLLLLAEGITVALAWISPRSRAAAIALFVFLLLPLGLVGAHTVAPAGRADCAGAARYVQGHRQPGERVTSNAWECLYYFRHAGATFVTMEELDGRAEQRVWLIFSGVTPAERQQIPESLPPGGWRVLGQREFARTTVFLLDRSRPEGGSP